MSTALNILLAIGGIDALLLVLVLWRWWQWRLRTRREKAMQPGIHTWIDR